MWNYCYPYFFNEVLSIYINEYPVVYSNSIFTRPSFVSLILHVLYYGYANEATKI